MGLNLSRRIKDKSMAEKAENRVLTEIYQPKWDYTTQGMGKTTF
jgi:hypothetical protein